MKPQLRSLKQIDYFINADADMNLAIGGVRSGKTVVSTTKAIHYVESTFPPELPMMIAGKTRDTVMANIVLPILKPFYGEAMTIKIAESKLELPDGRLVYLRGGADQDTADKIAGITLCCILFDEMSRLHPDFFDMALTRLSVEGARAFGTTNTDSPAHWLKKKYLDKLEDSSLLEEDEVPLNWKVWHFGLKDNPWLSDKYIEKTKSELKAAGDAQYRRLFLGEWASAEGAIYNLDGVLEREKPVSARTIKTCIGGDFGIDHPTVFVKLELLDNGQVWVTDELVVNHKEQRLPPHKIVEAYMDWLGDNARKWPLHLDPSAAPLKAAFEYKQLLPWSLPDKAATKGIRNVMSGIHHVSRNFGLGHLKVLKRCKFLIDQLYNYVWDEKATERGEDKPSKIGDDGPDALRYAVVANWGWFPQPYHNIGG